MHSARPVSYFNKNRMILIQKLKVPIKRIVSKKGKHMRPSNQYIGITGIIERMTPMREDCCNQLLSLRTMNGMVTFILSTGTYVVDNTPLRTGLRITAFYDDSQPVPLIYPPRYQAAFIGRTEPSETVTVAYFDRNLLSAEKQLKLNVSSGTRVTTANGQRFPCEVGNHLLIVYYGASTRSIPAQTTPDRIIVFC